MRAAIIFAAVMIANAVNPTQIRAAAPIILIIIISMFIIDIIEHVKKYWLHHFRK